MKGASTEPWAKINNKPINAITIMKGKSQSFLRLLKNIHSSLIKLMS
jgi:hypothetical protein